MPRRPTAPNLGRLAAADDSKEESAGGQPCMVKAPEPEPAPAAAATATAASKDSPKRSQSSGVDAARDPLAILYSAMMRAENRVGGGEGLEGVYGSITRSGTDEVLKALKVHAGFGPSSVVLDIGSGLGRPLLHAMLHSQVAATYGVEVDAVKCQKAVPFVRHTVAQLQAAGVDVQESALPTFICAPIEKVPSLEPATHIYSAWEGFARCAMERVGALFASSRTAKAVVIVQRAIRVDPEQYMCGLGFGAVRLAASMPVFMAGSRRGLRAYVFVRDGGGAGGGRNKAAAAGGDLSTMESFRPENVIGVLAGQADDRRAAKAATAQRAADGSALAADAGGGKAHARGVEGTSSASVPSGAVGKGADASPGGSQASADTAVPLPAQARGHHHGLRPRVAHARQ